MATSGLLIFAKSQAVHKLMQALFASRRVTKRYIAILDGTIEQDNGTISLPLTLNPQERPLQIVSHTHGKPAITRFEVLERKDNTTRIAFYPQTGRTHQLRVHSAHPEGLNTPIIGDTLYGTAAERLYLHAESVIFTHPITQVEIKITTQCPF
jgi:tRNA pseudouridine32 synthase/23S rRNA pseudouridine746 synthase